MAIVVLIIVGLIEGALCAGALFLVLKKEGGSSSGGLPILQAAISERQQLVEKFNALYSSMVDLASLRVRMKDLRGFQESLKAERGRITITQAELETVENRLRELEEIERELEASGLETKEEINILHRKAQELSHQNDQLKQQIASSVSQIDQMLKDMQLSAELQAHVDNMKSELLQSEQQITELMTLIEQGNEQYVIIKRRYDALDIEYAQLYEKFSEAEALANAQKANQ